MTMMAMEEREMMTERQCVNMRFRRVVGEKMHCYMSMHVKKSAGDKMGSDEIAHCIFICSLYPKINRSIAVVPLLTEK